MKTTSHEPSLAQKASHHPLPPGPSAFRVVQNALAFQRDPIAFFTHLTRTYGDICQFQFLSWPAIVLNHPALVRQVLVEDHDTYDKQVPFFEIGRFLVGNGLTTSQGEQWRKQRRLLQPLFHKQHLTSFHSIIVQTIQEECAHWQHQLASDKSVDVLQRMLRLTLHMLGKTIFQMDLSKRTEIIITQTDTIVTFLGQYLKFPLLPLSWPTPRHQQMRRTRAQLDSLIYELIKERRQNGQSCSDLLGLLLSARDEASGEGLSDKEVRDEVMTFIATGSETSATALAWTWYLLACHPEIEAALHQEVDTVLSGRLPEPSDLPNFVYTRMILEESMRLYPPVWMLMRRAREHGEMAGYQIGKHALIIWSPYLLHRHPDFWEEPERFLPERFHPDHKDKGSSLAYIPFGAGPHMCIASHLGMMEMILILATLASRFRLQLVSDCPVVSEPSITLRVRNGLPMYVRSRGKEVDQ